MTWSRRPWHITLIWPGSVCTLVGGFVPRSSVRTGPSLSGRKAPRKAGSQARCLANLFLHYAFDAWMQRTFPDSPFESYADDAIVHCRSEKEARSVLEAIRVRFAECGLELHPTKTKIVYCKDDDRPGEYEHITFDFLGYTFQPRRAKNRWGKFFVSFLPAISAKAAKAIRQTIREWRMASTRNNQRLEDLARFTNPVVRGWMNYYGRFYRSKCVQVLRHFNEALGRMGATEVQAVQTPGTSVDALAGAHRATGPQVVCLVGTRRATGGWGVRAG